jgi:hypothetical protein
MNIYTANQTSAEMSLPVDFSTNTTVQYYLASINEWRRVERAAVYCFIELAQEKYWNQFSSFINGVINMYQLFMVHKK